MSTPAAVPEPLPVRPPSAAPDAGVPDPAVDDAAAPGSAVPGAVLPGITVPSPRRPSAGERVPTPRTDRDARPVSPARHTAPPPRRRDGRRRLRAVTVTLLAGIALVAGGLTPVGRTEPGPDATAAPVLVEAAAPQPADTVTGTWTGLLFDPATSSVDVRLRVDDGDVALDIPSLDCRYTGTRDGGGDIPTGQARTVELETTDNPQDLCAPRAEVRLTRLSTRALRYELVRTCESPRGRCTPRSASAVLTRPGG